MTKYEVGKHFTKGQYWLGLAFVVNTERTDDENYFLNLQETVDLLNNLHKENEQLKQEAKELKKEIDYFERKKCKYWNMYNEAHLDRIILKKENKELKEKLEKNRQRAIKSYLSMPHLNPPFDL